MKNFYEYIDDYVNNNMNEADRRAFDDQMANDSGLKRAVDDYDVVEIVLDGLLEEEIRNVVESKVTAKEIPLHSDKERKELQASSLKPMKFLIAMAAILLAVFAFTKLMPLMENPVTLAEVYIPSTILNSDRGVSSDEVKNAVNFYKMNNLEEAVSILSNSELPEAKYCLAEIYFKEAQFAKVLELFPLDDGNVEGRKGKIDYLEIVSTYFLKGKQEAQTLINALPADTDSSYLKKYDLLK